jgi:hypothetical protein
MKDKNYHNRDLSRKKGDKISKEVDSYLVDSKVHEISCGILHKCVLKQTLHSLLSVKSNIFNKGLSKIKNHQRYPSRE